MDIQVPEDEDIKLEDSVRTRGAKDWVLIATLVSIEKTVSG